MTSSELLPGSDGALVATAADLQSLIESLIDLGVLVHDSQGTPQLHQALVQKTNQLVAQLGAVSNSKDTEQYPIPIDVLTYIEDGRNPDIYTREFVEVTAKSNARLRGKMLAFADLLRILGEKLVEEFPHLAQGVQSIEQRTGLK